MTDLFLNSQQLTQALAQLNKVSNSNSLAQQGAVVIVKHIAGNQLQLSDQKLSRQIELPKTNFQGNLTSGGEYSLKLVDTAKNLSLLFLSTPQSGSASIISQLSLNALKTIIDDPRTGARAELAKQPQILDATIKNVQSGKLTLALPGTDQSITAPIPRQSTASVYQPGQSIQVQLIPVGKSWQANIISSTKDGLKIDLNQKLSFSQVNNPKEVSALLTEALIQGKNRNSTNIPVTNASIVALATSKPSLFPSELVSKLNQLANPLLNIKVDTNGNANLLVTLGEVLAKIPVQKNQLESLRHLINADNNQSIRHQAGQHPRSENASEPKGNQVQQHKTLSGDAIHNSTSKVSGDLSQFTDKATLTKIVELLRQSQSLAANPTAVLKNIEQAVLSNSGNLSANTKTLIESVMNQINRSIPQGNAADSETIRQILVSPSLSLTATGLATPTNNQGLLAGLMTLLQITLGARLGQDRPQLMERVTQLLKSISPTTSASAPTVNNRTIQDINQLDQRGQLIRELTRLLANHQANKLASAEQAIQGQDSFYYVLPSSMGSDKKDIELLIRRDQEKNRENNRDDQKTSSWNLTMKLGVGEMGEMLGKVKLSENQLDLDIYTSNDNLKNMVMNFLPLLKQRFVALGIEVNKAQCQLGKIPTTLNNRPYHIFETQA